MNNSQSKKTMHPFVQFLIELLSVRAGFYVKQHIETTKKEQHRDKNKIGTD